ncbi:hypothetical protein R3P38DRAFT_3043002, partial [Favolaschia claudopus]
LPTARGPLHTAIDHRGSFRTVTAQPVVYENPPFLQSHGTLSFRWRIVSRSPILSLVKPASYSGETMRAGLQFSPLVGPDAGIPFTSATFPHKPVPLVYRRPLPHPNPTPTLLQTISAPSHSPSSTGRYTAVARARILEEDTSTLCRLQASSCRPAFALSGPLSCLDANRGSIIGQLSTIEPSTWDYGEHESGSIASEEM